jgi:DNA repair photolyase
MSGVTDCYQPVERKLKITRSCLEVLLDFRNPAVIITKNRLVTRDLDLLKELNSFQCISVNISITSLKPELARIMEPRASTPPDRLKAVEELSKAGIPVNVMVAPIVPALTDEEVPAILKAVASAGARTAAYTVIKLPYANKELFESWLDNHFPLKKDKVLNRIRSLRGGKLYDGYKWSLENKFLTSLSSLNKSKSYDLPFDS